MSKCELWVIMSTDCDCSVAKSLKELDIELHRRSALGQINYRLVVIQDLVLGMVDNQLCVYIHGQQEHHVPKVAFFYLPAHYCLAPHMLHAIHHLELMGIRCVNSSTALSICRNKVQQLQLVVSHTSVRVPDTVTYAASVTQGLPNLLSQPHNITFPAILKHTTSSQGKRVMLMSSKETVHDITHSLKDDDVYMLQHYVRESHGTHIRALVIGDQIHGVYRARNTANVRVQSNVSLGGTWEPVEGDAELERLALTVTRCLGLDLAGVDFVEDGKGQRLFLEANACPNMHRVVESVVDFFVDLISKSDTNIKSDSRSPN